MTLPYTAFELEVRRSWDWFLRRNALLAADGALGLVFPGSLSVRFSPISEAVDALLYIDAVSIFDASTEARLGKKEFAKLGTFDKRLKALKKRKDLLDYPALDRIRKRRNELGHEALGAIKRAELDAAVAKFQEQFEAWNIVRPSPGYRFFLERSSARSTEQPGAIAEWEYVVGIERMSDSERVLTFSGIKEYLLSRAQGA